ncbi:signal peptidase [Hyphomicrobium nitrativorans NL23]|uniref:Signal peptidase n=1 Tax=Hyphomicrobium nitrativorans NL23 TaxID=1029756 RepID=V5SFR7_9HYPH|nr:signal peptide peptidase SppA [Hyphomicrobium nitrativorans]AHB49741.1 signal peptidase [Hyphomicrobium nitrativorans NL23]
MSLETEAVIDRRRMRRRISFWRTAAVLFVGLLLGTMMFGSEDFSTIGGPNQIARVAIEGTITDNRDQLRMLERIRDANHVRALIVHVNSPGGTTTGGESLYQALREVAAKKPVVAQFGTVAASAGYIVGLGTDRIVARGNTITGSVGVLAQWPEVSEMLDKLGIKFNEVKSGRLKAEPNPFAPATDDGRRVMQETIDDGFRWFLSLVEERRGIAARSVSGLAEGRIFSGRQALEAKLIDEIGGEAEAVRWLQTERGISTDLNVVTWRPRAENAWSALSGSQSGATGTALAALAGSLFNLPRLPAMLERVGLDGLVSVWQPSEN